jgi:hypothetical protein
MTTAELADDPRAAIVEGVDIDLVAKTVRACAGVSDLVDGPFGDSTSYLPGRRVTGVSVNGGTVRVGASQVGRASQRSARPNHIGLSIQSWLIDESRSSSPTSTIRHRLQRSRQLRCRSALTSLCRPAPT